MKKKWLIVIVGATAVGKTAMAVQIARQFGAAVFSADSRQFYKEMNIATAKPNASELAAVPHYFIDSLSIHQPDYSAGKYEQDCIAALDDYFLKNDIAVMAGGSGLFVKAVCDGFDTTDKPEADEQMREFLNRQSLDWLQNELQRLDPAYFLIVDKKNPVRLKRAIEIIHQTGKTYSEQRKGEKKQRSFITLKIGLEMDREVLYARINQRVEQMLSVGLEEEAKGLWAYRHLNALQTVGYQEFFDFFDGKISREEAIHFIKQNTRNYAKRQMTWFKKDKEIRWFPADAAHEILAYIITSTKPII